MIFSRKPLMDCRNQITQAMSFLNLEQIHIQKFSSYKNVENQALTEAKIEITIGTRAC